MRMDTTAARRLRSGWPRRQADIAEVIKTYGEERFAARSQQPLLRTGLNVLETTRELVVPLGKTPVLANRVRTRDAYLQAIRIYINRELTN
jgi:16S rRNA C1402 N4-methylase RsmH